MCVCTCVYVSVSGSNGARFCDTEDGELDFVRSRSHRRFKRQHGRHSVPYRNFRMSRTYHIHVGYGRTESDGEWTGESITVKTPR